MKMLLCVDMSKNQPPRLRSRQIGLSRHDIVEAPAFAGSFTDGGHHLRLRHDVGHTRQAPVRQAVVPPSYTPSASIVTSMPWPRSMPAAAISKLRAFRAQSF